jgi:hypothetical protein
LRVTRRMSFTSCLAGDFVITRLFLISTSMWGQDEPQTHRYAIRPNSSMGADGVQPSDLTMPVPPNEELSRFNRFVKRDGDCRPPFVSMLQKSALRLRLPDDRPPDSLRVIPSVATSKRTLGRKSQHAENAIIFGSALPEH